MDDGDNIVELEIGRLTPKQAAFVNAYLDTLCATKAARTAGYSAKSARQIGCNNLAHPAIRAEITRRADAQATGASETLYRLSGIARGDMGDFLDISGTSVKFNFQKADDVGVLWLIKRLAFDKMTGAVTSLELYDAQAALVTLCRVRGLLSQSVDKDDDTEGDEDDEPMSDAEIVSMLTTELALVQGAVSTPLPADQTAVSFM